MTDKVFLRKLAALTNKMDRLSRARPYDPVAYNEVVARCNALELARSHGRRRRSWFMLALLILACLFFAWVIYDVLFYL